MGLKVLSICGGIETGLIALQELGITVDEYHTFEIFQPAIEISSRHFPFIHHHGNVIGADFSQFNGFDLVIAGTCCQSLSVVRQENDSICSGLNGKSGIFFEYARAVKEIHPRYFMLENVVPKYKADIDTITANLGGQVVIT
jgi:DNA (cytosine-5)-methyltransferase 3A